MLDNAVFSFAFQLEKRLFSIVLVILSGNSKGILLVLCISDKREWIKSQLVGSRNFSSPLYVARLPQFSW
ncbi:hypothetical protein MHLP_02570 [Candidatus Mycoplasma haematolamae str. Purdue]|uniref:Uncharacterized protein n=1 Tax=Mycoplasma haematolamae (strain Purdue) TaxID=1212765 RepID=I7CJQ7_MYCHA|nr:hypothetical protein MHLP_02570 [Candidatus Mycoplasma haematolamae str. Purdue]